MSDLTAKARRAAEWSQKQMPYISAQETIHGVWNVYEREQTGERLIWGQLSPGMLVGFAEDRGWQDQEQEADGVEWKTQTIDSTMVGKLMVVARTGEGDGWEWSVWDNDDWDSKALADGTAPTREEARRQAVEAARGMG